MNPLQSGNTELAKLQYLMVHFKNCIHEGTFIHNTNRREGPGITILDKGSVIIGNFKQDQLSGTSLIYLTLDTYFIGDIDKGCLNGSFVIRSPTITIYSTANINKIDGEILVINYERNLAQLWSVQADGTCQVYKDLRLEQFIYSGEQGMKRLAKSRPTNKTSHNPRATNIYIQQQVLRVLAPYMDTLPIVSSYIKQYVSYSSKVGLVPNSSKQCYFIHKIYNNSQMIYLKDHRRDNQSFLGVCMNQKQQIISYGIYSSNSINANLPEKLKINPNTHKNYKSFEHQYVLNGLGYLYIADNDNPHSEHDVVYQGIFINHKLHGEGSKQLLTSNKIIYGQFNHGDIRNLDVITTSQTSKQQQSIQKLLQKRKKSIHIHALQFINNYANQRPILIMKNLLRIIMKNQQNPKQDSD